MLTKIYKHFNQLTRQSLLDHVNGYVDKSQSVDHEINRLRGKYGIRDIYRFDLGENADGFSPKVNDFLENVYQNKKLFNRLNEYPEITHRQLRHEIALKHGVTREQIVLSTGLDSILDLITRVFFEYRDTYLMPVPDFFLFEFYSERMGAMPLFLPLDETNNFGWSDKTIEQFASLIQRFKPKIVWLSNPSNPSGQVIPSEKIHEIIKIAHDNNVFVVVDEAYGEFIKGEHNSTIKFVKQFENLMVLRTFSKAYGLAGIRLGYLISSSKDIIRALLMHRQHFPVTQLALNIALVALKDQSFIKETILRTELRKNKLFKNLSTLHTFKFIPTSTNIFMLKNRYLSDDELSSMLKHRGIFTSILKITGVENQNYMRVTLRTEKDNHYFYTICYEIEQEILQTKHTNNYLLV